MKLELKHLSPYLPYGLKVNESTVGKNLKMTGIEFTHELRIRLTDGLYVYDQNKMKPILRPLSDLNKAWYSEENEEDEEGFEQVNLLGKTLKYFNYKTYKPRFNPYFEFELLIKNHFDVFGLIEKGSAIDINTLKK